MAYHIERESLGDLLQYGIGHSNTVGLAIAHAYMQKEEFKKLDIKEFSEMFGEVYYTATMIINKKREDYIPSKKTGFFGR